MSRRARVAPLLLVALCSLLAGCSGSPAPAPTMTPSTTVASSSAGPAGPGATELGAKFDWGRFEVFRDYVQDLGGAPTFYEAVWCDIERSSGSPDWSVMDTVVSRAAQVNAELMVKIRVGQCWATGGSAQHSRGAKGKTESLMPRDLAQYTRFVADLVTRYAPRGVHAYAVENEINSESMWAGSVSDYEELYRTAATAVRAADPDAVMVDPGLSSVTHGYGMTRWLVESGRADDAVAAYNTYFVNRFGTRKTIVRVSDVSGLKAALAAAQRQLDYVDAVERLMDAGLVDVRQVHFYETSASVPDLMEYLRATTPSGVDLEAWEVGSFVRGQAVDQQQATIELTRKVTLLARAGMRKVLWLPLIPNPEGRNSDEPRTGLINPDGTVREQGEVFAQLAVDVRGAVIEPVDRDGLTGMTLTRAGKAVAYLWADTGTVPVEATQITPVTGAGAGQSISKTPVRADISSGMEGLVQ